jgi:hypothetical protein
LFYLGFDRVEAGLGGGCSGLKGLAFGFHPRQLFVDAQDAPIPVLQNKQFFDYMLHWATSVLSLPAHGSGPSAASQCGCWPRH